MVRLLLFQTWRSTVCVHTCDQCIEVTETHCTCGRTLASQTPRRGLPKSRHSTSECEKMAHNAPKPLYEEHVEVVQISSANGSGKPSPERVTARYRELVEKMSRIQRRVEKMWNSSTTSVGNLNAVGTCLCVATGTSTRCQCTAATPHASILVVAQHRARHQPCPRTGTILGPRCSRR